MAPEIIANLKSDFNQMFSICSFSSDIYSFSMLASEVFLRKSPYPDLGNRALKEMILNNEKPDFSKIGEILSPETMDWLKTGIDSNPQKRPKTYDGFLKLIE